MELLDHYRVMARMRAVELGLAELWHRGLAPGEMHLGTGEEALISGLLAYRGPDDYYAIDHRASPVLTGLGVPARDVLAECIGREEGLCRGRGGHMHLYAPEFHAAASGIVGAAAPAAVGFALAHHLRRESGVAFAFFGDGAMNQGMVLESFNLAVAWGLPVLFVCKDNGWAITTRSEKVTGGELSQRARGFGLRVEDVEGTDPEAVDAVAGKLLHDVRRGKGPALLHAQVARLDGHFLGDPLVKVSKDPTSEQAIGTTRELLSGLFGSGGAGVSERARSLGSMLGLDDQGAERGPRRPARSPRPHSKEAREESRSRGGRHRSRARRRGRLRHSCHHRGGGLMRFGQAIDAAVRLEMDADPRVFVMGEDVHGLRPELFAHFGPERIRATPISEGAFVGAGVAAAMAGMRPIVELIMVDFVAVAMDAVLNHMAKVDAFSGGRWKVPMVLRAPCGGGLGDGGQHEQCLWGMLGGIPGLTVVVPSTPGDAAGLMRSAIAFEGPVVFMEHKLLSDLWRETLGTGGRDNVSFDVPAAGVEEDVSEALPLVPIGEAAIRRQGGDVTVVSLGVSVHRALEAAAALATNGIEAEVIDLRTVRPLDAATVVRSVNETGRLLVVDEDFERFGLSGELAAITLEHGLTPRFARVCVRGTLPFARDLEQASLPNVGRIVEAARALLAPA